jgi:hypothetical protein
LFDGDGSRNEQWYGFGADVLAVADGSVSAAFDGMGEQTPNAPVTGLRGPRDYSGNHVSLQTACRSRSIRTGSPALSIRYSSARPPRRRVCRRR